MDALGVNNNNNSINNNYPVDKKVYYSFLNTPFDKVQISSQNSEQKDDSHENDLKKAADIIDPRKNYNRISKKIAGIAGAGALIMGLLIVTLTRGRSGSSEAIGNFLQKLRGQAYTLKNETSTSARIKYFFNTRLTRLLDGGLNTWVNTDQLKNMFIERKIVSKLGFLNKPIYAAVDFFRDAARKTCLNKYKSCVNKVQELEKLTPDLKKAIENGHNDILGKDYIERLNKFGLGLPENTTRSQAVEKVMEKIVENTKALASEDNFKIRQEEADINLEKVANAFTDQFDVFSGSKGIKPLQETVNTIKTSGKSIISRNNEFAYESNRNNVYIPKEAISRNIGDNCKTVMGVLKNVENDIRLNSMEDEAFKAQFITNYSERIRNLEKVIKNYKDAGTSSGQILRDYYKELFSKSTDDFIKQIRDDGYGSTESREEVITKLQKAVNTIGKDDQKGLVEELRDLMKCTDENKVNIIKKDNYNLYTEFKNKTDKFTNSLNKAAVFETDNLFFRLMDLKLGGGNYEILGFSIPIGYGLYHVSKADNKEEKVSRGIRAGSVIGGGLAGWVLSGVILCLSAGPALLAGLTGGFIFDHIGEFIDNKFWSKGKDWKAIDKQKKLEAKALKEQQAKTLNV